jgi:hypothetical protein
MSKNETVIIAAFADDAAAEAAIEKLREWDKRVRDVKLGVIGAVKNDGGAVQSKVVHGGLFNRAMPISSDAEKVLAQELSGGRVAVVVACDEFEAGMVAESLTSSGGRIMANADKRAKDDIAREGEASAKALAEESLRKAATEAKRKGDPNVNRPV